MELNNGCFENLPKWTDELRTLLKTIEWPNVNSDNAKIASVLLPIIIGQENYGDTILLIKRNSKLGYHKGQIGFPGGYKNATDADLLQTALRETQEEIGLLPSNVIILGKLSQETTVKNVFVFPWVGIIKPENKFKLDPNEVEKTLFLPIQYLLEKGIYTVESPGPYRGESIGIHIDDELVWGLTARILKEFLVFLKCCRFYTNEILIKS